MNLEFRNLFGKQNKKLRKSGKVPGCVYGQGISTIPVQVELKELMKAYKYYGKSSFFDVRIGGSVYSVVFKDIKFHPVNDQPINFDLFKADQRSKISFEVPLVLVGESPAVKQGMGILLCNYEKLNVYCLPKDLPSFIQIDVSFVAGVDSVMLLSDLKLPEGVDLDSSYDLSSILLQIVAPQNSTELSAESESGVGQETDVASISSNLN